MKDHMVLLSEDGALRLWSQLCFSLVEAYVLSCFWNVSLLCITVDLLTMTGIPEYLQTHFYFHLQLTWKMTNSNWHQATLSFAEQWILQSHFWHSLSQFIHYNPADGCTPNSHIVLKHFKGLSKIHLTVRWKQSKCLSLPGNKGLQPQADGHQRESLQHHHWLLQTPRSRDHWHACFWTKGRFTQTLTQFNMVATQYITHVLNINLRSSHIQTGWFAISLWCVGNLDREVWRRF